MYLDGFQSVREVEHALTNIFKAGRQHHFAKRVASIESAIFKSANPFGHHSLFNICVIEAVVANSPHRGRDIYVLNACEKEGLVTNDFESFG